MSRDTKRWFLSQDDSCHWYLVEVTRRTEWNDWLARSSGDPLLEVPLYARAIDSPEDISFTNPQTRE